MLELARTVQPVSAYTSVAFGNDGPKGDFHAWLVWNGQIIDPSPLPESECPIDADAARRVYIQWQDPEVDKYLRRHAHKDTNTWFRGHEMYIILICYAFSARIVQL